MLISCDEGRSSLSTDRMLSFSTFGRLVAGVAAAAAVTLTGMPTAVAAEVCYELPFSNPNLSDGFGATAGRPNPHRGVDFPQAGGTPIPAIADGVVVNVTSSGCLGNVIVLQHPDGMYSGYAHLQVPSPLAKGTPVKRGDIIGKVGTTGTCTTGNHLHLTLGPAADGWCCGSVIDPYKYIQEHKQCSCDRSAGGLTFSCDGPNEGQTCVKVDEPEDPDSWSDNHLCSDTELGLAWSNRGPIEGKECTNVDEGSEAHAEAWSDNYVCIDPQAPIALSWSSKNPEAGATCVHFNEPADPHSWDDNHLCITPRNRFSAGGFTFSVAGAVTGKTCVNVDEPEDPKTWNDNFLCTDLDIGLRWSSSGPIDGMRCTNVAEPAEHDPAPWQDNYVCVPEDAAEELSWSTSGPIDGLSCVRWYEAADLDGSWADNYLCVRRPGDDVSPQALPKEGPGAGGGGGGSRGRRVGEEGEGCSTSSSEPGGSPRISGILAFVAAAVVVSRRRRGRSAR
jgi:MYXO-CTERM domain-containing protein